LPFAVPIVLVADPKLELLALVFRNASRYDFEPKRVVGILFILIRAISSVDFGNLGVKISRDDLNRDSRAGVFSRIIRVTLELGSINNRRVPSIDVVCPYLFAVLALQVRVANRSNK